MSETPLHTDAAGLRGLFALAAGRAPEPDGAASLAAAGALQGDRPHPSLAGTLAAMAEPVCELDVTRDGRTARGWVDARTAVLAVPEAEERVLLLDVPPRFVPDAVARLCELEPRPRANPAVRLRFAAGALAEVLATRDPALARTAAADEGDAAAALVETLASHWTVEGRWRPAAGSVGARVVEVLDTARGLWLVVPDDPGVELWPTTPTEVFRLICALLPRSEELAAPGGGTARGRA